MRTYQICLTSLKRFFENWLKKPRLRGFLKASSFARFARTLSVRGRLTLWYLLVLGASLILVEVLVCLAVRGSISKTIDDDLSARLTATSAFLEEHLTTDSPSEFQDEFEEFSASRPGGELLQISDAIRRMGLSISVFAKICDSPKAPRFHRPGGFGGLLRFVNFNQTLIKF